MATNDLISASKNGNFTKVVTLISQGFSVHIADKDNATALYWSCCRGNLEICKFLLDSGSDVNAQVTWGSTALHAACDRGHFECVKLLLNSGANIHMQNKQGDSSLHLSAYRGHIDIVKLLIQNKANLFLKNHKGKTAAEESEGNNHKNTANMLFKRMQDILDRKYNDREDGTILSCPEHFGREIMEDMQSYSSSTRSLPYSLQSQVGVNSDHFVRYNSDITDFKRSNSNGHDQPDVILRTTHNTISKSEKNPRDLCRRESINNSKPMSYKTRRLSPQEDLELNELIPQGVMVEEGLGMTPQTILQSNGGSPHQQNNQAGHPHTVLYKEKPTADGIIESLQMQIVDRNENISQLEKKIREMEANMTDLQVKNQQYKFVCHRLFNEKKTLEAIVSQGDGSIRQRGTACTVNPLANLLLPESCVTHVDILDYLKKTSDPANSGAVTMQTCKEVLETKWLECTANEPLDADNREWHPGSDYFLLGEKPLYQLSNGQQGRLVLQIKHKGKDYMLKIIISLMDKMINRQSGNNLLDRHLIDTFGAEYDIPSKLRHPNIVKILHFFLGSSERFRKFENMFFPQSANSANEMTRRTVFLVTDHYPYTLKSYVQSQQRITAQSVDSVRDRFLLQLFYQLLSAVEYLHTKGVRHGGLRAESIFLNHQLRPVIADFGMAKTTDKRPSKVTLHHQLSTEEDLFSLSPDLSLYQRNEDPVDMGRHTTSDTSDIFAVGKIFYDILCPQTDHTVFPQSVNSHPRNDGEVSRRLSSCYSEELRHIVSNLVENNQKERFTAKRAMLHVGTLLYPIKEGTIRSENEARQYCYAQMLKLLALNTDKVMPCQHALSIEESVEVMEPCIEADFLLNVTPNELWEFFQCVQHNKCNVIA